MTETLNYQLAISLAKSAIERSSAEAICARTGAILFDGPRGDLLPSGGQAVVLQLLKRTYTISWGNDEFAMLRDGSPLAVYDFESIVVLHYLVHAEGKPLSGDWIPFRNLPEAFGGYSTSFEGRAVRPIVARFGEDLGAFISAAQALGGRPIDLASDAAYVFPFLPRLPITVLFWEGDDEFEGRASFLFDSSAPNYLPTEDITVAASLLASHL